jgi:hypothetical protein
VVLGAGRSIPCGMRCVEEINSRMREWSRAWPHGEGMFNILWSILEEYHKRPQQY